MIRDFSREELEPVAGNHTELTLGLGTVLGLGVGLLLLCTVCFAVGYAVGHRSTPNENAAIVVPDSASAISSAKPGAKPGAVRQITNPTSPEGVTSDSDTSRQTSAGSIADASSAQSTNSGNNPQVRSALQPSTSSQSDAPLRVQPATSQVQGWMVQIAAVSRSEDADVLVNALRRRGYTVTERRELGDNLIHVQTGPFASRNDANNMRQKLLNDGYNAIVQ
jgi:cell division septation protein DedD